MKRLLPALLALACGCSPRNEVVLKYQLVGIQPSEVVRVETLVSVNDPRGFFADQPYRSVADGVGYEVRDFDGSGRRSMLITQDATLGFVFQPNFIFTLLPPSGEAAPALLLVARAANSTDHIGSSATLHATFGRGHSIPVPILDLRCGGKLCATGQSCCSGACTDTSSDAANCGACNQACGAGANGCSLGTCRCGSGSACAGSESCCDGVGCVDLTASAFSCGACGHGCNPGETCQSGACSCGGNPACGDSGLCCPGGTCSSDGTCPCGTLACPTPNVCCDAASSSCIDTSSDNNNCGTCGTKCTTLPSCQNGACTCEGQICGAGDTCCPGSGCANFDTDAANCGGCGNACAASETCVSGTCQCGTTQCTADQSCCGGACVNSQSDSMNCGGCGAACNPGESCQGGMCQCPGTSPLRACSSPPEGCCASSALDGGGCFDLTASHDHCGGCGIACHANQECQSGRCVTTSCDPACTNQNTCDNRSGVSRCHGSGGCMDPQTCCAQGCTDTSQDANHCGNCNTACDATSLCCASSCKPRNAAHCQACDQACAPSGTGLGTFCCPSGNNWQCVPGSAANCGGCGKACTTGQVCCAAGGCKTESDFACGDSCQNCNSQGLVCCNHQCCNGICCAGKCTGCIAGLVCACL